MRIATEPRCRGARSIASAGRATPVEVEGLDRGDEARHREYVATEDRFAYNGFLTLDSLPDMREWRSVTLSIPVPPGLDVWAAAAADHLQRISLVHLGAVGVLYLIVRILLQR